MQKTFILITSILISFSCSADKADVSENKTTNIEAHIEEVIKDDNSEVMTQDTENIIGNNTPIIKEVILPESQVKETEVKKTETKPSTEKESKTEEIIEKEPIIIPTTVLHNSFNSLLNKYVSENGKVNYDGLKKENEVLIKYLKTLETNPPKSDWSKNEKLAYWINLYNASTISLILKNYPTKSIMDINGGKAWDIKFVKSGSNTYTLNQIENEIIRPTFKEPRIHFAVNCAAQSCPKLLNNAFLPSTLESQLDITTKKFINNKSKNNISTSSINISKIFEWYGDDFGGKSNLIEYFNKYSAIKINTNAKISFMDYDWDLNN